MTALFTLSETARAALSFWAFTLCITEFFCMIISVTHKRGRFAVFSLPPFFCDYLLWQVLFDIHLNGSMQNAAPFTRAAGKMPWIYSAAALFILTLAAAYTVFAVIRYGRQRITPNAVKLCLDGMSCGVCCWREDGRVLFSNVCMNRLCAVLTGGPLLNGNQFYEAVGEGAVTAGGKRWRFTCRDIKLEGERLRELIASDVTTEYARTQALESEKAELSRLNAQLRDYTLGIDDAVRRQEILQAKVNIHDEMNRLMLSTVAAGDGEAGELDRVFPLWEQNALLLFTQSEREESARSASDIEKLAKALKIKLIRQNDLPAALDRARRELFFTAAKEAIANAAKHARADLMTISFTEENGDILCNFENNGDIPAGEIKFTGGLYNLSVLAKRQGADVSARAGDSFVLTLKFLKNQPDG